MQKTFNVWVMGGEFHAFTICSKMVDALDGLEEIDADDVTIKDGAEVRACDVGQWLETFGIKNGEVRSFKLTLTEN